MHFLGGKSVIPVATFVALQLAEARQLYSSVY
jgi:hypothetical protein